MKNTLFLGMAVFLAVAAGCAGTRYSMAPSQEDNTVVYTQQETGRKVIVEIDPAFSYEGETYRNREGIRVEGYVFSGRAGKIFVTRLLVSEFEKVTDLNVPEIEGPYRVFPPGTFYNEVYCDLTRARAVAMGDEIVVAAFKKSLLDQGITCEAIDSLDALSARYPQALEAFDAAGDRNFQMRVQP